MNSVTSHTVDREDLMAFLDGQPCGDAKAVAAHLESCAECKGVANELRATAASLRGWTVESPSAELQHPVLSAAGAVPKRLLLPRKISWKRWTLIAAGSVCGLLLVIAVAIPNLLRSKMAANEANQVGRMRTMEGDIASLEAQNKFADAARKRRELAAYAMRNPEAAKRLEESKSANGLQGMFDLRDTNGHSLIPTDTVTVREQIGAGSAGTAQSPGPMIARTANLRVVVPKFEVARTSLDMVLTRYHAYAASLEASTTEGSARTITASLRIPAPQMSAALADLKALGRVENESQSGEEVTEQHADLVARLKNSRETEVRLQDILRTRTGKVSDVLEVEQEIARVRGEIERMEGERKGLEHRVDFATISLSLVEEYKAKLDSSAPSRGTQLRNSLVNGIRNAYDSFFTLILFLAEAVPVLLVWLLILSPLGWFLWRRFRAVRTALT